MAQSAAEEYGLSPAIGYTVLGLRASPDASLNNLDRNRAVEAVALYCQSYRRRAATTIIGHTVYCVLADGHDISEGRVRAFAAALGEHVGRALLGRGVQIALSRTVGGLHDIPAARQQVDRVLESAAPTPGSAVTTFDDALARISLADVRKFLDDNRIGHPKLDLLRSQDLAGSEYMTTLAAYLSAFGNAVAAARALNVHVTTLRYRLKRIQAVSGLDLDDPAERLLCELLLA